MTAPVQLSTDGAIAIIRIDNPPVNALNHVVRTALHDALEKARDDAAVQAIVVGSNGSTFSGGADITEFGKPPLSPTLLDLIDLVEAIEKPTVVAVQGVAFGGGLEMALAFHFRVAGPEAQFGLPEVKIGLLPGAGGTQRLPRAIGMMEALKMIVTGDPIGAEKARDLGLVDVLADGDAIAEAVALARKAVSEKLPLRRVRDRQDKLEFDRGEFDALAGSLMKRARGLDAPLACVRSVRNAAMLTFDAGLKQERELFIQLLNSEQSKAQRHVFFAERAARKVPDMPASVEARKIERVAVIGGGTMGRGIAMSFANAGIPVTITETSEAALVNCLAADQGNLPQRRGTRAQ